ncbi:MAG: helix-turn-helix transcriptional regulator [Firmicutes bacterium]|nr:helix-turn-helix transcriptional regulator [Bacillota bacterium]
MFGKRLKELRIEKDYSQKDIANYLGISDRAVGYYESEERFPPQDILRKLADFYNVSVDYLLGRTDMRNPQDYELIKSISGDDPELLELLKEFTHREDLKEILKQLPKVEKDDIKTVVKMISGLVEEDNKLEIKIKDTDDKADKYVEELSKDPNYKIMKNE